MNTQTELLDADIQAALAAAAPAQPPRQDARDLQAHLYRQIGISAVAAALSISTRDLEPGPGPIDIRQNPAMLKEDDLAA